MIKFKLLSINARHDGEGWTWDNHYTLQDGLYLGEDSLSTRKILKALRKWGNLCFAYRYTLTERI